MKTFSKILAFTFVAVFGSVFLGQDGVSAKEIDRVELQSNTIDGYATMVITEKEWINKTKSFPDKIWQTKGNYGGYLKLVGYEYKSNHTFVGTYRGKLYLNAAPLSINPSLVEN